MTYREMFKELVGRLTSRKLWAAIAASVTAYELAGMDGLYSVAEILTIIGPLVAFIGVEGVADTAGRMQQSAVTVTDAENIEVSTPPLVPNTGEYNQGTSVTVNDQPVTPNQGTTAFP